MFVSNLNREKLALKHCEQLPNSSYGVCIPCNLTSIPNRFYNSIEANQGAVYFTLEYRPSHEKAGRASKVARSIRVTQGQDTGRLMEVQIGMERFDQHLERFLCWLRDKADNSNDPEVRFHFRVVLDLFEENKPRLFLPPQ